MKYHQTPTSGFSFLCTAVMAIAFVWIPDTAQAVGPSGYSVRSSTAAARAVTPTMRLRGSAINSYEMRVLQVAAAEEKYQSDLAKWEKKARRIRAEQQLKAQKEQEKVEKRNQALGLKEKLRLAKEELRAAKKAGAQKDKDKKAAEIDQEKETSVSASESKVAEGGKLEEEDTEVKSSRSSWSVFGSRNSEGEKKTEDVEDASEEKPLTDIEEGSEESKPQRRSLWGHLRKALW